MSMTSPHSIHAACIPNTACTRIQYSLEGKLGEARGSEIRSSPMTHHTLYDAEVVHVHS